MRLKTVSSLTALVVAIQSANLMAQEQTSAGSNNTQAEEIMTIVVTGSLRDTSLQELPTSVSVIDQQALQQRGATQMEDVIGLTPNVNFAGGSNRARFYQIRGIGERSQFVEPLNPSVGVIVDGIDMSGIADGASLLDVEQVEVFRGPQGTLYGANALAGLINVKSNDPSDEFEGSIETTLADYDTRKLNAVISGPATESVGYRLAVQSVNSDGFTRNDYLKRDDTHNQDELTLRGKIRIDAADDLTVDLTALHINNNNGYDAFSLDDPRRTISDQPGHDRQKTTAFAIATDYTGFNAFDLQTNVSVSDADLEYGYDEDWTYDGFHPYGYSSTDNYIRDRKTATADIRLVSASGAELFNGSTKWVTGIYAYDQQVDMTREYTYQGNDFTSEYDSQRFALYGQLDTALSDLWSLTTGLRVEQWQADYKDSEGVDSDPDETLWGGRIALEYLLNSDTIAYGLISRGYKAGGFNSNGTLPEALRTFDTEYMWNYELGLKGDWLNSRLQGQLAFFWQQREDVQIKGSRQVARDDGSTEFIDYTANSAEGHNYGVELEGRWLATSQLTLSGSVGLLQTELKESGASYDGRDQAYAPSYQMMLAALYQHGSGWYSQLDVEAKDKFYLSDRHDEQTDDYALLNARIGYRAKDWDISLWAKNLTDKDYIVRGFGAFGNDPRNDYTTEPYYQLGAPRLVGMTAKLDF
ncbi:TonB-dependent receptor [Oceanospirillum sediminis]|uniref:TonB-dependent receptor n=1 Tax=Oceanospirillum sediminis TaxID=2760088 RepID=A0A839IU42_9GAMM|nr:TonB-dependent receptor [Oceanospirillum sediminis]MBB1487636.1 TonB-dependent receptor [Oceanospirillum sediminis]